LNAHTVDSFTSREITQVVKRITREISAKGTETVTIRFILLQDEVERVEEEKRELRREAAMDVVRQRRRQAGIEDMRHFRRVRMPTKQHSHWVLIRIFA
jgi:hypothetical protein